MSICDQIYSNSIDVSSIWIEVKPLHIIVSLVIFNVLNFLFIYLSINSTL